MRGEDALPLFVTLYKTQGSLVGKLQLDDGLDFVAVRDNGITGTLAWIHPDIPGQIYTSAFDSTLDAFDGAYHAARKRIPRSRSRK